MASKNKIKVKLVSTGKTEDGKPTGTYYTTTRNKKLAEKLSLEKYDRRIRKKVLFKEEKIK